MTATGPVVWRETFLVDDARGRRLHDAIRELAYDRMVRLGVVVDLSVVLGRHAFEDIRYAMRSEEQYRGAYTVYLTPESMTGVRMRGGSVFRFEGIEYRTFRGARPRIEVVYDREVVEELDVPVPMEFRCVTW